MATDSPKPMSPTAAVARHLEWLEFALAAARDEEARRKGRLDKATPKNRERRTVRLAEVSAEVVELAALVTGLKNLRGPGATTRKAAAKPRASAASKPRAVTAASKPRAATAGSKPRAVTAASKPRAVTAASKPRAASPTKPRPATARKTTRAASKPSTRARKPRAAAGTAPAAAAPATAPTGPTA